MFCIQLLVAVLLSLPLLYWLLLRLVPWLHYDVQFARMLVRSVFFLARQKRQGKTIIDMFEDHADNKPSKPFILYRDDSISYRYAEEQMNKMANVGLTLGLKPGDVVALLMPNEPSFVYAAYGLCKLGMEMAYLNFNLRSKSLLHCFTVSGSKSLIIGASEELVQATKDIHADLKDLGVTVYVTGVPREKVPPEFISIDEKIEHAPTTRPDRSVRSHITLDTPMCYIYTSGTTGLPKAAIVSYERAYKGALLMGAVNVSENDVIYTALPLYHSAAGLIALGTVVINGGTLALRSKFSASNFIDDCRKYNVTIIQYIGELCRYLCARPKSPGDQDHCIRAAFGNGLRRDIWREFRDRFNIPVIGEFYAATEGNAGFMNYFNKIGSCGRASPLLMKLQPSVFLQYDVALDEPVRNDKGFCVEVGFREPGLMATKIKTNFTFDGYKGNRDLTNTKILKDVSTKGDLYFNSGDLMEVDEEYFVYFKDRVGDTFRWKGENVATIEVSNVITDVKPIEDANVYGVEISGQDGRAGMAAVTLSQGSDLSPDQLQKLYRHCSDLLPTYALPRFLRIQGELELTSTLKQRKVSLVKEGFDPAVCGKDPVYCVDFSGKTYTPMTTDLYQKVLTGNVRL